MQRRVAPRRSDVVSFGCIRRGAVDVEQPTKVRATRADVSFVHGYADVGGQGISSRFTAAREPVEVRHDILHVDRDDHVKISIARWHNLLYGRAYVLYHQIGCERRHTTCQTVGYSGI